MTAPHATAAPISRRFRFALFTATPGWLVSSGVHFAVILALACIYIEPQKLIRSALLQVTRAEVVEEILDPVDVRIPIDVDVTNVSNVTNTDFHRLAMTSLTTADDIAIADGDTAADVDVDLNLPADLTVPKDILMKRLGTTAVGAFDGRGAAASGKGQTIRGCTPASEAAVAKGLQWLAEHQLPDGGWNFDHRGGGCNGACADAGTLKECRTGATAMALLPFLGAGQTHRTGKYRKTVESGLYFLLSQMKVTENRGDLSQGGGNMYSHGLAAIVLCEAYAMTHEKSLAPPAQLALNHIVYAQDPVGGGWRYTPRTPGDTSVVGWQLMALKSGHLAYLRVPEETIVRANKFLDSVQTESGGRYGYTTPGGGAATSAVGVLSRMYLGWKKDHPGIERGVEFIGKTGPSRGNMYFNYYAAQVLRHYGGEAWDKWNPEMRDYLVNRQDKVGHQTGSWHFNEGSDHGAASGGRLYCTSMATMILEVYYRHMPLYAQEAADDDFR